MLNGDPLSNNLENTIITNAQTTVFNISSPKTLLNAVASINGNSLTALCGNPMQICAFNITNNNWICIQTDTARSLDAAFNKVNPSTTLPLMNNNKIVCNNRQGSTSLFTRNSQTIFIYDEPYNFSKRINCLYYWSYEINKQL